MHYLARLSVALGLAASVSLSIVGCAAEGGPTAEKPAFLGVPDQFRDNPVADGLGKPTALAFTPDGLLLIGTQAGQVRVVKNGGLLGAPALALGSTRVCTDSERGLLGLAVDPGWASNHHVFAYYSAKKYGSCARNNPGTSPVNRVSRFTYDPATDTLGSELILLDNIVSLNGNHNGGDVQVGGDGYLYVSVGDSGCQLGDSGACGGGNRNAIYTSILNGKILRIGRDGSIPSSNPYASAAGSRRCGDPTVSSPTYVLATNQPCREIYAHGLRNPFRIAFKPGTNPPVFHINDVGQNTREEIDVGALGANYGWNDREGKCEQDGPCNAPPAGITDPIYHYGRSGGCVSITGGAFVPSGAWGNAYDSAYLFADYGCGKISKLSQSGGTWTATTFGTAAGSSSIVAMAFGPGQAPGRQSLYYSSYTDGGVVRRVDFIGNADRPPVAMVSADPTFGAVPLTVTFDGSASADPDAGDSIAQYEWTFGDGGAPVVTMAPTTTHVYTAPGNATAQLRVRSNRGDWSLPATLALHPGDTPPALTITSPTPDYRLRVGDTVSLTGTATDTTDGPLAITWQILRHHGLGDEHHTHPAFGPETGNGLAVALEGPEDLLAATTSHFEIIATATDSSGLSTVVHQDVEPQLVDLTFDSVPSGRTLVLNNTFQVTTPHVATSWAGWGLRVEAPDQRDGDGRTWTFASWSDGGDHTHIVTTPDDAAGYTATFAEGPSAIAVKINFQPAASPVPAGYRKDDGTVFGDKGDGLRYGWNVDNTNSTRDRNMAADQRYDTTTLMQKFENRSWEIALPNGSYDVHLVAGDAGFYDSTYRITAEGVLILSGTPTSASRWIEATATVTVTDGRLTIDNGAGSHNNKVCFVEIQSR